MRIVVVIATAVAGVVLAAIAQTATLDTLEVTRKAGRYELYADTYLAAPPSEIYSVLLEYDDDAFRRISSVYKESRYLAPQDDGTPTVFTLMEGCVLFYCMSMRRTERLEAEEFKFIRTESIPEESDFKYAMSEWLFSPEADGTRMKYTMILEPDFFVPPIVGPWVLKRVLSSGGARVIARIERIAQGEELPFRTPRQR